MIRPATASDLPRLYDLLLEMQQKSKFAPDIEVDERAARSLLMTGIQRNGSQHDGGALLLVEERDEQVEGFIMGMLDRVYHIGTRLCANDIYLYCTEMAAKTAALKLAKGYIEWAMGNPKVAKIMLSWTDALGVDGESIGRMYNGLGFHKVGEIWERDGQ